MLMSDSDESGGDESPPDSGSDWSEAGKEAAAEAAEAAAEEDDDVSMAGDSDNSLGSADASKKDSASRKRRKPSPQKVFSELPTRRNSDSLQKYLVVFVFGSHCYFGLDGKGVIAHLRGSLMDASYCHVTQCKCLSCMRRQPIYGTPPWVDCTPSVLLYLMFRHKQEARPTLKDLASPGKPAFMVTIMTSTTVIWCECVAKKRPCLQAVRNSTSSCPLLSAASWCKHKTINSQHKCSKFHCANR